MSTTTTLKVATVVAWVGAVALMLDSVSAGTSERADQTAHLALLFALAGNALGIALTIRWASGVLVHVLALYHDDLPTPQGRHAMRSLLRDERRTPPSG